MTGGISFGGIASGLDTETMISQLIALQRQPRAKMELRERFFEQRETTLNDVATRLKNLKTAAADLSSALSWSNAQKAETTDAARVSATISGTGAAPGGYQLEIAKLASSDRYTYTWNPPAADTTLLLDPDDPAKPSATIDIAAGATVEQAAQAINDNADSPAYALVVDGKLVLSSKTTGADKGFNATPGDLAAFSGVVFKEGEDAVFTVDGNPHTSASNTVSNAIPGVQLQLKSLTAAGTPVTVSVTEPLPDNPKVKDKIKAFVEQYNSTIDFIRGKLDEKRVPDAATSADATKGVLFGDTGLTSLLTQLRRSIQEALPISGQSAALDQFSELGIGTGKGSGGATSADALAGKLTFDETVFDKALESDPLAVRRLLGGVAGVEGFAQKIEDLIDPYTKVDGTIDSRKKEADSQAERLRDQMARLDERLIVQEERLRRQFASLETLLSRSQAQQQWLTGQLNGLL
jgi:flagellar hook-associated protein 2